MKRKSMHRISVFLDSCMFFVILLFQKSSGADWRYDACSLPKRCDKGPNISFPFFIRDVQQPFCGLFEVYCIFGYSMIKIPDNDFVIDEIFYHNRSFRLHNAAVAGFSNNSCPLQSVGNITLNGRWFNYSDLSLPSLHLLSRCNNSLPEQLKRYGVPCDNETRDGLELAMLGDDKNLNSALEYCEINVESPVEFHGDEGRNGVVNYDALLRRGFTLNWTASNCSKCEQSGGHCGMNTTTNGFRCFCPYGTEYWKCKSRKKWKTILLPTVASAGGVVSLAVLICSLRRIVPRCNRSVSFWKRKTEEDRNVESFLKNCGSLAARRYNYSDVKKMTDAFKVKLGEGGYGTVYKGKLKDGSLVAVKFLKESKRNGEEFLNEMTSISRTSHVNIVTLLGFCVEGPKKALIYEFMPNGSLEKFICGGNAMLNHQLELQTLFKIAVGIARGLEYLHRGCNTRILHFDIKPHNILLDDNFCPKISDFGLAKLCAREESRVSTMSARGTIGYIAPEFVCKNIGRVSHKSDVYSYGMMVLKMVGGKKNIDVGFDQTSEMYFPHWIYTRLDQGEELRLSGITNEEENKQARKMLMVSLWCIQTDPSHRPSMTKVVEMLEGSLEALQMPPKPYLSSPARASSDESTT